VDHEASFIRLAVAKERSVVERKFLQADPRVTGLNEEKEKRGLKYRVTGIAHDCGLRFLRLRRIFLNWRYPDRWIRGARCNPGFNPAG